MRALSTWRTGVVGSTVDSLPPMPRDRRERYPATMTDAYDLAPKVELHLHLEGAIPASTLWALVEAYGDPATPSPEAMAARFEYRDFAHFIETWQWMLPFIRTADDWMTVAEAVARSLVQQHIVYAEASISPTDFRQHGLSVARIATAVRRGLDRVEGTRVNLLVDLVRDTGPEWCGRTLEDVIEVSGEAGIVGITIGGSEHDYPPAPFAAVYRRAAAAGLGRTVHAGEAGGPANVWSALQDLGVDRIGHGVRAVEDTRLVDHLVAQQVPLEVCPTSNIRTGVVSSWAEHPVIELIERRARVTINSDDPMYFGCSVAGDMRRVAELTEFDVERHTHYAIDAAFADTPTKHELRRTVSAWWAQREVPGQ
jgi:adenosine deaminase